MVKYVVLVLLIAFALVVVGVLIYLNFSGEKIVNDGFENIVGGEEEEFVGVEEGEIEEGGEVNAGSGSAGSVGGGGGAGGGGAGGGSGGGFFGFGCEEQQIAYALKNFIESDVCNNFQGSNCVDRTVNCSLEVHNLDYQGGGVFGIKFVFFEEGGGSNTELVSILKDISLEPRTNGRVDAIFNVQNADADKEIDCIFSTTSVPKKEVCN